MLKAIINHRGSDFRPLLKSIKGKLQKVLETNADIVVLSSSGTGAVEAAVKNIVKPHDNVIVPVFGEFSQRLAEQAAEENANVITVNSNPGSAPSVQAIEDAAKKAGKVKAIFVVYNDTSPGTTYRWLERLSSVASSFDAFLVADSISIVGGDELPQDKWGIDMVVGAAQKCLAAPPGVAFVSVSERLKKYLATNRPTTTYFDLNKYMEFGEKGETPFTPALPLFYAFDEALSMVLEEGMPARINRHRITARAFYDALSFAGLNPFVEESVRSNVVVTIAYPSGVDDLEFRGIVEDKFNVILAGGFGPLKGKIFRIGNMGEVSKSHVLTTLNAIASSLNLLGHQVDTSAILKLADDRMKELKVQPQLKVQG
ncbi:MAG: alanine--glyoxylate aminotransferase family protein [Conexivisphaerales archaeon]